VYYKISGDTGGEPNVYMQALNNTSARIKSGEFIANLKERRIYELPFRFEMQVQRNADGSRQEPRLSAYYYARELMQKKLVEVLQSAGVDNLQVFPAVITEEGRDTRIEDYVVVNVVGLVACAAVGASDSMPFAGGLFFNDLVIDPTKTGSLLMFRLAESKMDVLVHERVVKKLQEHQFPFLVLTPLKEA
jgi:hypothetical protein